MFKNHWKEEVSELVALHELHKMPAINALGYKLIAEFLTGKYPELSEEQLIFQIQKKTRNYAKKQQTFFKSQIQNLFQISYADFEQILTNIEFNWDNLKKNNKTP